MNLDIANTSKCVSCSSSEVVVAYYLKWQKSSYSDDIVSRCSAPACDKFVNQLSAEKTKLTLEEAKVLIVKSRL